MSDIASRPPQPRSGCGGGRASCQPSLLPSSKNSKNTNFIQNSWGGLLGGLLGLLGRVWEPSWAWKTRRFDDMAYFPFDRIQVQASFEKGQARPGSSRAQKMPKKPRIIDVSTPKMAVFWPKMDDSLTQVGPWMARGTPRQVRVSAKKSPFPSQTGSPEAQESGNGPTSGSHRLMASRGCHM